MTYRTQETVILTTGAGNEIEVEFEASWCSAEPDVGIMGDWIEEIAVVSSHSDWLNRIIDANELFDAIVERIYDGQ